MKYIVKREGMVVPFESDKIKKAIEKAFLSVSEKYSKKILEELTDSVLSKLTNFQNEVPTVELVQDLVEETLMENRYFRVAKSYIVYRNQRSKIRDKLLYKEEYDLSFIKHVDYKDEDIVVWDFHETDDEVIELDVYELFKDGIGELTNIKDIKSFCDILIMKLISYQDYHGTIVLKSFQESLTQGIKENFARYYFDYLEYALSLMTNLDAPMVIHDLKQLVLRPDLDNLKYYDGEKMVLSDHSLDDGVIAHIQRMCMEAAYRLINKNTYYYVNAINDILLSYQECVTLIYPGIKIQLRHPKNIEEQIIVEAVRKITGVGE